MEDKSGTIVIVNGPSAIGKSSFISAFIKMRKDLWLHAGIDHLYVGVIPLCWLDDSPEHSTVMTVEEYVDTQGKKAIKAVFGPQGEQVIKGMHRSIAAYAQMGSNIIADYIQYDPAWLEDFATTTQGVDVVWVGLTAALSTVEARELQRKTSPIGHARSHYDSVHKGIAYDLYIDVDSQSPEEAAAQLVAFLDSQQS